MATMTTRIGAPTTQPSSWRRSTKRTTRTPMITTARMRTPVEERYKIWCERGVSEERLRELGVEDWSKWETGKCKLTWHWKVDQLVYIRKGSVKVAPIETRDVTFFHEGDLLRYPKWFHAALYFQGSYQESYRFMAYGDDYAP